MFKILILIIVLGFLYIIFFRKSRESQIKKNEKDANIIADEMVECPTCKTLVSKKEAILSNGRFYCSKECL